MLPRQLNFEYVLIASLLLNYVYMFLTSQIFMTKMTLYLIHFGVNVAHNIDLGFKLKN